MTAALVRRIVYLVETPWNERDRRRFGVELLEKNGFVVEAWDSTPFRTPALLAVPAAGALPATRVFASLDELRAALRALDGTTLIVSLNGWAGPSDELFRALGEGPAPYGVVTVNAIPPPELTFAERARARLARLADRGVRGTLRAVAAKLSPPPPVGEPTLWIAGGEATVDGTYPFGERTEVLWAHAFDYDVYLDARAGPSTPDPKEVVFLDDFGPFAPDYLHIGAPAPMTAERWYPALRAFFDRVERERGVRVTVAAHPRSRYEEMPGLFGDRPVIRGRTSELVRRCGWVILTFSTALDFAVLFEKPSLFITSEETETSSFGRSYIRAMARSVGKRPLRFDRPDPIDWDRELALDAAAYADYRARYVKKRGTPEVPLWQIVADRLRAGPLRATGGPAARP